MSETVVNGKVREFLNGVAPSLYVGGEFVAARSGSGFTTVDPSANSALARCDEAGAEEVADAVAAAQDAMRGEWRSWTPARRRQLLLRIAELLERDEDHLAELEALDCGKPVKVTRAIDVPEAVEAFRYFAGLPQRLEGRTIPVSTSSPFLTYTRREPVGIVGQIIPWNYPLLLAAWKLAPALACGNACILKPAEQSPLTALWLARLLSEAGVPKGVVSILTGGPGTGRLIVEHPSVTAVNFTGSTEVGREIIRASAGNLKRLGLELGGKSPHIVFADADLARAAVAVAEGGFWNSGQECAAGSRVFVESRVFDEFIAELSGAVEAYRLGPALSDDTDLGPLISEEQRQRVMGYIDSGVAEGAELVLGGSIPEGELGGGFFVEPTVFAPATNQMKIAREEIFGPVLSVIPVEGFDDAIAQANATPYGLAAGVWTRDVYRAHRAAEALEAGMVWVNAYNAQDAAAPFGGYKESGIGREMGEAAIELHTEVKTVWVALD